MTQDKDAPGALTGITVLDLSRVLAGPYCTQILGDHGAEIIKVEPPSGDETRTWGPPFADGDAAYYVNVNRNKRSIALDLANPAAREVVLALLEKADVLIENFKTGTLEKWGIGNEVLAERFPRLVHCRVSGFGADGPYGGHPGYDAAVQAWAGLISVNGSPEGGPVRLGVPMVDMGTGLYAAIAILMALQERSRSGKGQFVETALFDCAISFLHPQGANWMMSGKAPRLLGSAHPNISPYDLYPTSGRAIFLAVGNDRQFRKMCEVLGEPELGRDPRFATNADRLVNRDALDARLKPLLATHDGLELAETLMNAGVPAGAALSVPDVYAHPHTLHRGMFLKAEGYKGTGTPIKFGRTPGRLRRKPPKFGADGRAVLREAGFAPDKIEALAKAGVLVEKPGKSGD